MWQRQEAPWENGSFIGDEGGLYKSTDGGETFTKLTGHGLPEDFLQVQLAIAPSNSKRLYAEIGRVRGGVDLMRSDDGGESWVHAPVDDTRPEARIGGGDVPVPKVDPKDPDTGVCRYGGHVEVDRRRQDLDGPARRARRRRLSKRLD